MSVQTREKLLRAAKKVFAERGFHNAQISHIIDEAGVARGTFYLYFKGKEEIFKEILNEVITELKKRIKVIDLSRDPVEQLKENIINVIDYALQERELARIVLNKNCDPELFSVVDEFFEEVRKTVKSSLDKGVSLGIIREVNTEILSYALVGTLKEVIRGLIGGREIPPEVVAEEIISIGLKGVLIKEGGRSHGSGSALQGLQAEAHKEGREG
ncbi:TetR/AcrR family transcriptional regulator [Aquifex pyrophilus]